MEEIELNAQWEVKQHESQNYDGCFACYFPRHSYRFQQFSASLSSPHHPLFGIAIRLPTTLKTIHHYNEVGGELRIKLDTWSAVG
jgi:hypothetical protein